MRMVRGAAAFVLSTLLVVALRLLLHLQRDLSLQDLALPLSLGPAVRVAAVHHVGLLLLVQDLLLVLLHEALRLHLRRKALALGGRRGQRRGLALPLMLLHQLLKVSLGVDAHDALGGSIRSI